MRISSGSPNAASSSGVQALIGGPHGGRRVVRVGHLLAPLGLGAVVGRLVDRDVGHEPVRRGAVPVPLPGRRQDRVPGPDLQDLAATRLDPADAVGHVQRLAHGVDVPRVAGAGREADDGGADPGRRLAADDLVEPGVAGEHVGRCLGGRPIGQDLHRVPPWVSAPGSGRRRHRALAGAGRAAAATRAGTGRGIGSLRDTTRTGRARKAGGKPGCGCSWRGVAPEGGVLDDLDRALPADEGQGRDWGSDGRDASERRGVGGHGRMEPAGPDPRKAPLLGVLAVPPIRRRRGVRLLVQ